MLEPFFYVLGVVNNLALIVTFVMRRRDLALVERYGWAYLLLAAPAVTAIVVSRREDAPWQYTVFLAIFVAFLVVEALYDWVLKIPFRATMDWRVLTPYVALYLSSTYGFVVMAWRWSAAAGVSMLALTVAQLAANLLTHRRVRRPGPTAGHAPQD